MLVFLFPLCIVLTFQLFTMLVREFSFYLLSYKKEVDYSFNELFVLLKILVNKKLWFKSIKLLERQKGLVKENMHQYFNSMGFIYYNMKQYNLAQLYYLKAVNFKKDYLVALQNLAKVYDKQKKYVLAISTYESILLYDKDNKVANRYLKKRKKKFV